MPCLVVIVCVVLSGMPPNRHAALTKCSVLIASSTCMAVIATWHYKTLQTHVNEGSTWLEWMDLVCCHVCSGWHGSPCFSVPATVQHRANLKVLLLCQDIEICIKNPRNMCCTVEGLSKEPLMDAIGHLWSLQQGDEECPLPQPGMYCNSLNSCLIEMGFVAGGRSSNSRHLSSQGTYKGGFEKNSALFDIVYPLKYTKIQCSFGRHAAMYPCSCFFKVQPWIPTDPNCIRKWLRPS